MSVEELETIFHPCSIAIVGASDNPSSAGYFYTSHLLDYNYRGKIYPINPHREEILGLKAYPSLREVEGSVDYVICCLPASRVIELLPECPEKGVKAIHLFTGRLSETGYDEAIALEKEILQKARELGIRLIGPNCMGIYYPKEGISFGFDFPKESGGVGMVMQSGGASTDFIRFASLRGVRFSKVISYGNALDLNETDFLHYLSKDPETKVIAGYIEGVKEGRKFLYVLREASRSKPVIVLKAGRSDAGVKAASSHTAALTGSLKTWETAIRQAGAVQAQTMEEMIDLIISFYFLPPILGKRVGIMGGGGGRTVLSADEWEEAGFSLVPLPPEIKEEIRKRLPQIWWEWLKNPIDRSILPLDRLDIIEDVLEMMAKSPHFDLIVATITIDNPLAKDGYIKFIQKQVEETIRINKEGIKPLVVVLNTGTLGIEDFEDWRWRFFAEEKARLVAAQVPVYSTLSQAARAVSQLVDYYQGREARQAALCASQ